MALVVFFVVSGTQAIADTTKAPTISEEESNAVNLLEYQYSSLSENSTIEQIKLAIVFLSRKEGIDEVCFLAICEAESGFRNVCNSEYGCGSGNGLMQIIPSTARDCSKKLGRELDPTNLKDNLDCATYLLKEDGTIHWGTSETDWGSWDKWNKSC